jgi:hypothetical protein
MKPIARRASVRFADRRRRWLVLCGVAGIASSIGSGQLLAQGLPRAQLLDCKQLLEGAERLKSASSDMLAAVRQQRERAKKMRDMLGPDVADESIAFLAAQERQLESTVREAEAIRCPVAPAAQSPETPR